MRQSTTLEPSKSHAGLQEYTLAPPPNPYPQPPAPRVEIAQPPRETVIWEPGRWHWNGRGYVWIDGHYVERVVGQHWQAAHWAWNGHNWVWIGGRWG